MKKRIWYILFLIPLLLTIGSQRSAAQNIPNQSSNEQVQIILHKLLFTEGNLPDPQKNTGEEQVFFQEAQGLNEVSFSVYDVTASFYQLREQRTRDRCHNSATTISKKGTRDRNVCNRTNHQNRW